MLPWERILTSFARSEARSTRLLRLIKLAKLLRLIRAGRIFRHLKAEIGFLSSTWRFIETFAAGLLLLHWSACMYMLVAMIEEVQMSNVYNWKMAYEDGYEENLVDAEGKVYEEAQVNWYILCLSYGLCLLGGWSFDSPVQPITHFETTFSVFAALLFTGGWAYVSAIIVDCVKQTNLTKSVIDGTFDNM